MLAGRQNAAKIALMRNVLQMAELGSLRIIAIMLIRAKCRNPKLIKHHHKAFHYIL